MVDDLNIKLDISVRGNSKFSLTIEDDLSIKLDILVQGNSKFSLVFIPV